MQYFHLRKALDEYSKYLQEVYTSNVQVDTGALKRSIKVWCTINGSSYSLHLSALDYWKFIPQVFPWQDALIAASLPPSPIHLSRRAFFDNGSRYPIDFSHWQSYLNSAFELDILQFLNDS